MKHKSFDQLEAEAQILTSVADAPVMSHRERLARWITLLERDPWRVLTALRDTEFVVPAVRDEMRADNSPITVAYEDPVLRSQGLKGDAYADARRFFSLTDEQLHDVVCHCWSGRTMMAGRAAHRVRMISLRPSRAGLLERIRSAWDRMAM